MTLSMTIWSWLNVKMFTLLDCTWSKMPHICSNWMRVWERLLNVFSKRMNLTSGHCVNDHAVITCLWMKLYFFLKLEWRGGLGAFGMACQSEGDDSNSEECVFSKSRQLSCACFNYLCLRSLSWRAEKKSRLKRSCVCIRKKMWGQNKDMKPFLKKIKDQL